MTKSALHNLTHTVKLTCNMGQLIPIACYDVVPGDVIDQTITAMIRTQPLATPVMHECDIDIHAFFVPDRIVHDDAEEFQSGGDDGLDTTVAPFMTVAGPGYAEGSLCDYYGLPIQEAIAKHDAKPIRGYGAICNFWYRDSQLVPERVVSTASGLDTTTDKTIFAPAWKRDYFTKARPKPQLGVDTVIPLLGDAEIRSTGNPLDWRTASNSLVQAITSSTAQALVTGQGSGANINFGAAGTVVDSLVAYLGSTYGVSIRALRESSAVQRFLEFNNNFGGRYMEQLMSRFNVRVPDFRLQWPEYLGGGTAKFQFSEVLATAETDEVVVGDMKGHGISLVQANRFKRKIPEHGYVHVLMTVRPKTAYMQGLHRMWSRETKYDYLLPEFVAVGDQPILNKEIYNASAAPNNVFGYTPIYDEYRSIPSRAAGEMRTVLKDWHMVRDFASEPALNATFISCNPTNRVFAVQDYDQLIATIKHDILARRPLPRNAPYKLL